jgi:hypothetical protein
MICPICKKGELINFGLLTCCVCEKMWTEPEFLGDVKKVGLAYYFTPNLEHGTIVIYDPKIERHNFIEPLEQKD